MIYNIEVCICKTSLKITDAHKRIKEKRYYLILLFYKVILFLVVSFDENIVWLS